MTLISFYVSIDGERLMQKKVYVTANRVTCAKERWMGVWDFITWCISIMLSLENSVDDLCKMSLLWSL